ncbi:MAG TPA: TetR/AcrR family transcriptional regulator [Candidatus Deferrimicrobiaceae bacterium]|nr:TetR/AcrR family transcriptional regulator [Candidatus Deferrimicrobiaceae bacterium]
MNAKRKTARAQILRAAADLFRERGYQASTVDHIAGRLGMSKASLYTHFRAKDEMLAAISRETIEAFTRDLNLVLGSRLDPAEKLRRMVRQHVRFVIANRSFLTVFFGEEANLPPRFARSLAAQKDRYDKGVERIVAEGVRAGIFRDVPPRLVVFGVLGMVNWVHKWYNPAGRWGAEEISSAFLSLIEGGLLRRKRRGRALGGRLRRLERELHEVARQLDA